jgi:hypothetical protein
MRIGFQYEWNEVICKIFGFRILPSVCFHLLKVVLPFPKASGSTEGEMETIQEMVKY